MQQKIKEIREIMAEEMIMRDKIIKVMQKGPLTILEIAEVINKPTDQVMFWIMGMRKYGFIIETEQITEDDYYKYKLIEKED